MDLSHLSMPTKRGTLQLASQISYDEATRFIIADGVQAIPQAALELMLALPHQALGHLSIRRFFLACRKEERSFLKTSQSFSHSGATR